MAAACLFVFSAPGQVTIKEGRMRPVAAVSPLTLVLEMHKIGMSKDVMTMCLSNHGAMGH